ncbi:MAG: hypothetical protein CMJ84_16100 [Planctomycetes bacterium]|jgi:hypothetical protein|nr:hypothetical protein [Planctomycetota bacterium]MDP6407900.1 hypothetical protein [Planctomycetota bacterium]
MRVLTALAFFSIHVAGGLFALHAFGGGKDQRVQLGVLADLLLQWTVGGTSGWGSGAAIALLLGAVAACAALALACLVVLVRRRRETAPVPDVFLHLRAMLFCASACLVICAFVLSTAESYAGPFRVRFPVLVECTTALAYGAFALWSISLPRLRRILPKRVRSVLAGLSLSLPLLLLSGELGLRGLRGLWPHPILVTDTSSSEIRRAAGRRAPESLLYGFPINSGGHYDKEFLPRSELSGPLVVSIGDSFSYGTVPLPYHYTSVCERELPGVEIHNMGYPATGPNDYLYLLENEALALEPDLILIEIFLGNDIDAIGKTSTAPRWYDADRYLLSTVAFRLQSLKKSDIAHTAGDDSPAEQAMRQPWLDDPFLEEPSLGEEIYLQVETKCAAAICERTDQLVWSFRHVDFLKALVRLERAAGDVPLAFVLIPDEFHISERLWEGIQRRLEIELDRDLPQRETLAWARNHGRAVLDLTPALRAVAPLRDGERHLYHLRNMHFNKRGNEVVGRELAPFVRSLLDGNLKAGAPYRPDENLPSAPDAIPAVQAFGGVLESLSLDGETVFAASLLPLSKAEIRAGVFGMLKTVTAPKDITNLTNAAVLLAYFQDGVGSDAASLNDLGPDGAPWRERVQREMAELTLAAELMAD